MIITIRTIPHSKNKASHLPSIERPIYEEIVFETFSDAKETLTNMDALIHEFGSVTISDLYELAGIRGQFAYRNWGWKDLSGAIIKQVEHGYIIDLPKVVRLQKDSKIQLFANKKGGEVK